MPGKNKAPANLHKTKTAAPKKSTDALSKLVATCNEQIQEMQEIIRQQDSHTINQRHSTLVSRAESMSKTISRSRASTYATVQRISKQVIEVKRELEEVKLALNDTEDLEETMIAMQRGVEQCLIRLGATKKRSAANATGKKGGK